MGAHRLACWGLVLPLLLGLSRQAAADAATCKRVMSKAHEKYIVAVAKAKAKEAAGRVPGHKPVAAEKTAAKIERARQRSESLIAAGCIGVADPKDADPRLCPMLTGPNSFADCYTGFVATANTIVRDMDKNLVPECYDDPVCNPKSLRLPLCNSENGCFCHSTVNNVVRCINAFDCAAAQPCDTPAPCPTGQECFINTCCDGAVCGPVECLPQSGSPPGGSSAIK